MQTWLPLTAIAIILIYCTRLKSTLFPKYWQKISIVAEEFKHNDQLYVVLGEIATHLLFVTPSRYNINYYLPSSMQPNNSIPTLSLQKYHPCICCLLHLASPSTTPKPASNHRPRKQWMILQKKNNTRIIFCVFALYVLLVVALAIVPGECLVSK